MKSKFLLAVIIVSILQQGNSLLNLYCPTVSLSRLDYPFVGMLVPGRVDAFVLFCFVLLAYTPAPLFAVCLLTLHWEVTPQAGDDGVPVVFMFYICSVFTVHSV